MENPVEVIIEEIDALKEQKDEYYAQLGQITIDLERKNNLLTAFRIMGTDPKYYVPRVQAAIDKLKIDWNTANPSDQIP